MSCCKIWQCPCLQGIQLIKQLRKLDSQLKQDAEVAVYLKQFDQAEALYRRMDRPDLAVDMRMRLGDWLAVSLCMSQSSPASFLGLRSPSNEPSVCIELKQWRHPEQNPAIGVNTYQQAICRMTLCVCDLWLHGSSGTATVYLPFMPVAASKSAVMQLLLTEEH